MLTEKEKAYFSLSRALSMAADGGLKPSIEREMLQEWTEQAGRPFMPNRFTVPFEILARDMTAAGVSGSNYLVSTVQEDPTDVLRAASLVARLGATILPGLRGNVTIPKGSTAVAGGWMQGEMDTITAEDPVLGQVTLTPKTAAALLTYSHQLGQQAPSMDGFLARHLSGAIGVLLDKAALQGTGASGEPLGIANTTGTETATGASWAHADTLEAIRKVEANDASPSAWVAAPATVETLAARDLGTDTARFVWDSGRMGNVPAYSHTAAPAATLILGDWRHCVIGTWGGGVEIMVDPFSSFNDGRISMRAMLTMDVGFVHPGAFCVAGSVS